MVNCKRTCAWMLFAVLTTLVYACGTPAAGEPADKKAKPAAKQAQQDEQPPKDRYQLPKGGVKELLAFIKEIRTFRPKSQEEADLHGEKAVKAIQAAAEKVQKIAKDSDKQLEGLDEIPSLLLAIRAMQVGEATPEEQKKLIADIKARLAKGDEPNQQDVAAAMQTASTLEETDPKMAATAYRELGETMAKSKNEQLVKIGERMEGAARRLLLVGNPLELKGTEFDSEKFDWEKYRGKVVLVDFWATWCGPCRAELPNVKKNYQLYHDRGFEVVGVSLDDDREALEKLMAEDKNPWVTLYDGGWEANPNATYYGIMGIPTVILVDKEGKVVSTNARGPELGKLLASLLGPAEEKKE